MQKIRDYTFYVMYNMHWTEHEFALPKSARGYRWSLCIDTDRYDINGFYSEGNEEILNNQRVYTVGARTIAVLKEIPESKL